MYLVLIMTQGWFVMSDLWCSVKPAGGQSPLWQPVTRPEPGLGLFYAIL